MFDKYIRPEPPTMDELIEEKNALLTALNESTRAISLLLPYFKHDGSDGANATVRLAKRALQRAGVVPTITPARTEPAPDAGKATVVHNGHTSYRYRGCSCSRCVCYWAEHDAKGKQNLPAARELYAAYQRADEAEPVAPELDLFQTDDADSDNDD